MQEEMTQGSFVPHGYEDILDTVIGRLEHPSRVRAAGSGVTISQFFGQAPRSMNNSSASINLQQSDEIIGNLKEQWRREFEEENRQSLEKMKEELKEQIKME